jgi:hypothetical protein
MIKLRRISFLVAALSTLFVLGSETYVHAGDQVEVLGPVGPHQPILTTVGSKRVIAFYTPSNDNCDLQAVVWDNTDVNDTTAARVRVNLSPGQMVQIDTPEQRSLNLQCGDHGKTLVVVDHEAFGDKKASGH